MFLLMKEWICDQIRWGLTRIYVSKNLTTESTTSKKCVLGEK